MTFVYKFTGKERDTESGLDYFGARYYASSMGRFMSPDWSPPAATVPYASLGDPQSLNLYRYVCNNPMNAFDPDGHDGEHGAAWDMFNENVATATGGDLDRMGSMGISNADGQTVANGVNQQAAQA